MTSVAHDNVKLLNPFDRLIIGMNTLGSVWILFLILLVTTDAMSRSFFLHPIAGVTEMVQISIVGIVFLQLGDAIRNGKLTRADSLLTLLQTKHVRLAHGLETLFFTLGAIYMALGMWASVPLLMEAVERKSFLGNQGVFTIIVWPVKAVLVLGLLVCLIQFLRLAFRSYQLAFHAEHSSTTLVADYDI